MPKKKTQGRTLDAMPDTVDFRDQMYIPTLIQVAQAFPVEAYRARKIPVLDQGSEGACTGFGLATVINFLLRLRGAHSEADDVSAKMLYAMAKRYDEWPGENYEGSSARGAMKGWHKHGVCAAAIWDANRRSLEIDEKRSASALQRPLGAYFRVNHRDLVGMHSAITEAGILYATARVHQGWMDVRKGDTDIVYKPGEVGGHAFAIVAYDQKGFWIQNSWGADWGSGGLARVSYADWLANGTDVWVARLGAPIDLTQPEATARMNAAAPRSYESYVYSELRPHVVTAGNDGKLLATGSYGLTKEGLRTIIRETLPKRVKGWAKKRVLLYAHGGLVPESAALQYVASHREYALQAEVYPIAFIWRSDAWTTIRNILQDAMAKRKDEGLLDSTKDFMLDRLDDTLEVVARQLGGKALWDEMKENATLCAKAGGAARWTAEHLVAAEKAGEIDEIHLVGHSAGSILLAPLTKYLTDEGLDIASLTLWAPACTMDLFKSAYKPLIDAGKVKAFDLFTLDDTTERDDNCANIYNKSLLYLVSAAFEAKARIPLIRPNGTPLLGLARDVSGELPAGFWNKASRRWFQAPQPGISEARHHGDFNDDSATLLTGLQRITGGSAKLSQVDPPERNEVAKSTAVKRRIKLDQTLKSAL